MAITSTTSIGRWKRRPRRLRAMSKPSLIVAQILAWADAYFKRTRRWPTTKVGRIRGAIDDTWYSVDKELRVGRRGLDGGASLVRLLCDHRGVRNRKRLPPYSVAQVLAWADAYHRRIGRWPNEDSGPVEEAPGETWKAVESALRPGGARLPWRFFDRPTAREAAENEARSSRAAPIHAARRRKMVRKAPRPGKTHEPRDHCRATA
jgi:hypothetical protein